MLQSSYDLYLRALDAAIIELRQIKFIDQCKCLRFITIIVYLHLLYEQMQYVIALMAYLHLRKRAWITHKPS